MNETATSTCSAARVEVPEHAVWEVESRMCDDYDRNCVAVAAASLRQVGFAHVDAAPWEDVLSCMDGDLPVTVKVVPAPPERWEPTIGDLEASIDADLVMRGASLCTASTIMADAPLPEHARFDVMGVCILPDNSRCRVHHIRGVWHA